MTNSKGFNFTVATDLDLERLEDLITSDIKALHLPPWIVDFEPRNYYHPHTTHELNIRINNPSKAYYNLITQPVNLKYLHGLQ